MRIQLFYSPSSKKGGNPDWAHPPLGILYLASYARNLYPQVEWNISDGQMDGEDRCLRNLRIFQPDLVGVSFVTAHAEGAYKFIDKLKKERPDILIVCGGPHPSALPEEVLSRSAADIVVVGEGERSFATIIEEFIDGKLRVGGKKIITSPLIENLDSIPFPARDLVDIKKYPGALFSKGKAETAFVSSRGCPYNCWFCSNPAWKAQKPWYRPRSPKNIVDEIQLLKEEYGIKDFSDHCDEFNVNIRHAIQICDEIIWRKLDIHWKVQMTAQSRNLPEELIEKMAESGCWQINLGLESGNQATLRGIGKRISLDEIEHACYLFKKHRIKVFGLFMLFNVWEENGELRYEGVAESLNTIKFAKSLRKRKLLDYLSCTITTPFPKSSLWDTCVKHRLILDKNIGRWDLWDSNWNQVMRLPNVSNNDWSRVRAAGGKLQAYSIFANLRDVNINALPRYIYKAKRLFKLLLPR